MQKLINWCNRWGTAFFTLALLAFIPLYPKLPLIDVTNTWVYVRVEDFVVLAALLCFAAVSMRGKQALKTPLTVPILLFWLVGLAATLQGVILIFPTIAYVYSQVAFLSLLRRIEYMSLFFIAFAAMKEKRLLPSVIVTLTATVFLVSVYGIGQKYLGFPAFLTMNEEFAKGMAIRLSSLSRVSSTFGGHYDLAAYLVLTIPSLVSLVFGYANRWIRGVLLAVAAAGAVVLMMTVSRISFFGLLVAVGLVLLVQRTKLVLFSLPVLIAGALLFLSVSPSLANRFSKTLTEVDVLVNARTGHAVGQVKEVPSAYFVQKQVKQQFAREIGDVSATASPAASFVIPYVHLPERVILLTASNVSTGEDLPSGGGYVNLTLAPVVKRIGNFMYEPGVREGFTASDIYVINGDYLLKKALAYDISFTTRFQGEWPNAVAAFKRNILLGSGYGSVSLAVDNSYLRMLAETGIAGTVAFAVIFFMFGMYLYRALPLIDSAPAKSFVLGFAAGLVGLGMNGIFIDVFEASKVAYTLWLLMGVAVGILHAYHPAVPEVYSALKQAAVSTYAIVVYILILVVVLFSPVLTNYFVGDDFTWFRWAATCGVTVTDSVQQCVSSAATMLRYVTNAQGFFYRPGAKMYFQWMYDHVWLNQSSYHTVSVSLHFLMGILVFVLARKLFRDLLLAAVAAVLFVILSGFSEAVFWISATGFLFTSVFALVSVVSYAAWLEAKRPAYAVAAMVGSIASMLFHEMGVVVPFLCFLYEWSFHGESFDLRTIRNSWVRKVLILSVPAYAAVRWFAQSHWFSGDYNYNVLKFPLNAAGNLFGYVSLTVLGSYAMPLYEVVRRVLREHVVFSLMLGIGIIALWVAFRGALRWNMPARDRALMRFAFGFSLIALLPFLGLGNIAPRYGYLASVGFVLLAVYGIRQAYRYLLDNGRDIAVIGVSVAVGIFGLFHVMQLQQLQTDWHESGDKVTKFLVAMGGSYDDYWTTQPMEFHLVHVPIRHRSAWVFPVGIPDSLWFIFRNARISVVSEPSLDAALQNVAHESKTQKIFVFADDGSVREVKKTFLKTQ